MINVDELQAGESYIFHIKPWESPTGEVVNFNSKQRVFVGMKTIDRIPFVEVARASGSQHLIAVESIEQIEMANQPA